MDKGFRQGRVAIAILAVALLVLALPTLAFAATFGAPYPAGTVHTAPQLIGVNVFSSSPLDVRTAAITIDGVSQHVAVTGQGSASGDWSVTEMLQTDGSYKIHWTWTASAADSTEAQLTCAPASPLSNGTHHVVATIGADSVAWDMNVQVTAITPVTPPSVTATAVVGCACHPGFQIGHHGDADCNSCHSGADLPAHGSPITGEKGSFSHSIMPVASMDTTNQACVASGCHSTDLVTTHDHAACASCHTSAPYNAVADTCVCHGDAGARPTGDLAHNIAAAVANSGATLECTTCHNTPNHMGHTVANYYGPGTAAGEPNHHLVPGALSAACVACHGSDLPTVHSANPSYGGVAPGCVCHTGYFVGDVNKVGIGNTPDCVICHVGQYGAHGFDTATAIASGHNTTEYGKVGAYDMFDGSQGPVLHTVETSTSGSVSGRAYGNVATLTTSWDLPPQNVFKNATPVTSLATDWSTPVLGGYYGANGAAIAALPAVQTFDGRSAVSIMAGVNADSDGHYSDQSLLAFKPNETIDAFSSQLLSWSVENQSGSNPAWVYIELNKGQAGDVMYQYVPATNRSGWHVSAVDTATPGWYQWTNLTDGVTTGPSMTLAQVAAANTGKSCDRVYLTVGMGDSYHDNANGTVAWIDKATVAGTTYDFCLSSEAKYDTLSWNSVITCEDCHSGLAMAGPHGANDNWGIDTNYPGDFSYAELTKYVATNPSGIWMRSNLNLYRASINTITAGEWNSGTPLSTDASGSFSGFTYYSGAPSTNSAVNFDGQNHAVICSKCHQLYGQESGYMSEGSASNLMYVGTGAAGTTVGSATATDTGAVNTASIGGSNIAHGNHHTTTSDGSAQCVNCHVAIPHGWVRPRLLVNSGPGYVTASTKFSKGDGGAINSDYVPADVAPYRSPNQLGMCDSPSTLTEQFSYVGMQSLDGLENHDLTAVENPATSHGNPKAPYANQAYNTNYIEWGEENCSGCDKHSGQNYVLNIGGTNYKGLPYGSTVRVKE